ncbi:unnamed protein product [Ixodes hexagonus]
MLFRDAAVPRNAPSLLHLHQHSRAGFRVQRPGDQPVGAGSRTPQLPEHGERQGSHRPTARDDDAQRSLCLAQGLQPVPDAAGARAIVQRERLEVLHRVSKTRRRHLQSDRWHARRERDAQSSSWTVPPSTRSVSRPWPAAYRPTASCSSSPSANPHQARLASASANTCGGTAQS